MYNPEIKPSFIPDLCSVLYDSKHKDWLQRESSYRVTGYYKAVPKEFKPRPDMKDWEKKMMRRLFHEWTPNWTREYRLVTCVKEEATHVCGSGVCGVIACLTDSTFRFTSEMVNWTPERIQEENDSWNSFRLDRIADITIEGVRHTIKYLRIKQFKGKRYQKMVEEINKTI